MSTDDRSMYVTRREFNGALVIIWLYIMLVLGDLWRLNDNWSTGVLLAASFVILISYAFLSLFSGRSGTRNAAPLSDKVKELARDPNGKIEAIKLYREETGAGLAEAKDAVEAYIAGRDKA